MNQVKDFTLHKGYSSVSFFFATYEVTGFNRYFRSKIANAVPRSLFTIILFPSFCIKSKNINVTSSKYQSSEGGEGEGEKERNPFS